MERAIVPERRYAQLSRMDVSVVIATRNRARRLAAVLESLRAQTHTAFEVIVVDDGSADDTQEVVARELDRGAYPLRLLAHEGGGGPGAVRNTGWPHAKGELVAFVDDDCEVEPGWLAGFVKAAGPDRILQGSTTPIERELPQGPLTYTYDITSLDLNFPTCNMAYPKALLERLGGFDAAAFPTTGEDCDLAWRAIAAGAEPVFVPEAHARHAVVQMDRPGMLRRAWRWGDAMPAFARHPELRRRRLFYRFFYNLSHFYLLRLIVAAALPRGRALWALRWWLARRYVEDRRWAPGAERPSADALAWNLVVDGVEMAACARGSIRSGTLVL
jgi:glycosyltransferase involved in cell wall biosynthesis